MKDKYKTNGKKSILWGKQNMEGKESLKNNISVITSERYKRQLHLF